jgi:hypothetical protein
MKNSRLAISLLALGQVSFNRIDSLESFSNAPPLLLFLLIFTLGGRMRRTRIISTTPFARVRCRFDIAIQDISDAGRISNGFTISG